jgi:hypothetical protein
MGLLGGGLRWIGSTKLIGGLWWANLIKLVCSWWPGFLNLVEIRHDGMLKLGDLKWAGLLKPSLFKMFVMFNCYQALCGSLSTMDFHLVNGVTIQLTLVDMCQLASTVNGLPKTLPLRSDFSWLNAPHPPRTRKPMVDLFNDSLTRKTRNKF